jgi:hypothetical protein
LSKMLAFEYSVFKILIWFSSSLTSFMFRF